jgi:hypothetical protein
LEEQRKLEVLMDFRYGFLPLINFTLWVLIPQAKDWALDPNFDSEIFAISFLCLVIAILILLFLFTSVKFPLTLSLEPFQFSAGDFSTPLTLPLVASLFFPPDLFWFVFPMHLILSPWYGILSDLLKRIIFWFCDFLQAIPAFIIITCTHQHPQVELEATVPQVELEAVVIEENNEGNI